MISSRVNLNGVIPPPDDIPGRRNPYTVHPATTGRERFGVYLVARRGMISRTRRVIRSLAYFGSACVFQGGVFVGLRLNRDGATGMSIVLITLAGFGELVAVGLVLREVGRLKHDDAARARKESDAND